MVTRQHKMKEQKYYCWRVRQEFRLVGPAASSWVSRALISSFTCLRWTSSLLPAGHWETVVKKAPHRGFPRVSMAKNPPANAGEVGSIPGSGRSHVCGATEPVCHNYWACALKPTHLNYWNLQTLDLRFHNKKSHHDEKPVHSDTIFRVFYIQDHVICKQWGLYFFFSILDSFYFFFCSDCCGQNFQNYVE